MIGQGADSVWVSKMLGHKDVSIVLKIYAKFIKKDGEVGMQRIEKFGKLLKIDKIDNDNSDKSDKSCLWDFHALLVYGISRISDASKE